MKNQLTMPAMMSRLFALKRGGERSTLLGIGPMSKTLIKAVLELSMERDFPVMLIASRNQVDSDALGGGYVCGWDQDRFVADVHALADQMDYNGLVYLCRDHGGPWQRDEERAAKLPAEEAMEIAKRSYVHDMESGFDLLHIDPTKDPHIEGTVPLDLVLSRTVELIEYLEGVRQQKGLPPISYEVGTEETNGGLTSETAFADFIEKLLAQLHAKGLPTPAFVVGQTGTLTRLTENIGHFDGAYARTLSDIAMRHGVGLKEHNADYLRDAIMLAHPPLGVTASNVAPEYGVVETRAYLELCALEALLVPEAQRSSLHAALTQEAVACERWRKWMVGDTVNASLADVMKDAALCDTITDICGHYTFETAAVREQMALLTKNLAGLSIDVERYAVRKIKESIDKSVQCYELTGLTSKLLGR